MHTRAPKRRESLDLAPIPNVVALESLRGWMAWLVVVGHAAFLAGLGHARGGISLPGPALKLIYSSDAAVRVFIILSGFAIANLVLSKQEPYRQYIGRRAFRIFPIYLFCLLMAISVTRLYESAYLTNPLTDGHLQAARLAMESKKFFMYLMLHLTLLHGVVPNFVLPYSGTAFLAPAWTISLEWQFYLIAPAIIWGLLAASRTGNVFWVTLGILVGVRVFGEHFGHNWMFESFLPLIFQYFLLGMLSRIAMTFRGRKRPVELFLAIAATFVSINWTEALVWSVFYLIALHEVGILHSQAHTFQGFAWLLAYNPVSKAFGTWSYSTYLIHVPLLSIVFGVYLEAKGVSGFTQPIALGLVAVAMALTAAASYVLYARLERPFIHLGRRVFQTRAATEPVNLAERIF
jgi:peptidoglycan/LPS O-acetylase OafA/YrhL